MDNKHLVNSLALLGFFQAARLSYSVAKSFIKYFVAPRRDLKSRYGGGWALVTGASDGLGRQYCFELAKSGLNIILMARNQEKLDKVAGEIRAEYPDVKTKTLVFNFSELHTEEQISALQKLLREVKEDVSVLVNNVGVLAVNHFDKHSIQDCMNSISVNVSTQTYVTHALLPVMLQRSSRCAIVNLSSRAALVMHPLFPVYSGTKAFNYSLSTALRNAYSDKIDVLTVTPASVKSGMNPGNGLFTVTPEMHGKYVIDHLGRYDDTWGHWHHAIAPYLEATPLLGHIILRIQT